MLMQPWIKVMYYSLLWLTWHIKPGISTSHLSISWIIHLSIPRIVVHGRCYTSLYILNNLSVLFCFLLIFFLYLLIKQVLFSHETVKVSTLLWLFVCLFICLLWFLSLNYRVKIHNLIAFLQFPKGWQLYSF